MKFIPTLSSKNVFFIEKIIEEKNIDTIIEYGSGNSTLYFLNKYKNKPLQFISVENDPRWFKKNIKQIRDTFSTAKYSLVEHKWKRIDYQHFLNNPNDPYTHIQDGISRFEKWKEKTETGPFYRFNPESKSKFKNTLGPLRSIFQPIFKIINTLFRNLGINNYYKAVFNTEIEKIKFDYYLIMPAIKDQFGESPNREEYATTPFQTVNNNHSNNILFMIDAGPRHYILDKIIETYKSQNIHVCLFDAQRPEYEEIISKYNGSFHKASTNLINDEPFYRQEDFENAEAFNYVLERELWYYES